MSSCCDIEKSNPRHVIHDSYTKERAYSSKLARREHLPDNEFRDIPKKQQEPHKHPDQKFCVDEEVKAGIAKSYIHIDRNVFKGNANGLVSTLEHMVCECSYDENVPLSIQACGINSGCINRELFIECTLGTCPSGEHCQNQKFNKKDYAGIQVIQCGKKGFGVRATQDIPKDTFIIEYCGEVITEEIFTKRALECSKNKNKPLYFVSLKPNEYIDASRKGNVSRFINHSCDPNCILNKWIVGVHWRLGIFSRRDIKFNEEITFDYKFDCSGQNSQRCYCGSSNCNGYIGLSSNNKNAIVDSAERDDSDESVTTEFKADTLEPKDEVAERRTFPRKKRRTLALKNTEREHVPPLKIEGLTVIHNEDDIRMVCRLLLRFMNDVDQVRFLLERMKAITSEELKKRFLWCHGLRILSTCISHYKDTHLDICHAVLIITSGLKICSKNSAMIIKHQVETLLNCNNHEISSLSLKLLEDWSKLQYVYKIPKKSSKKKEIPLSPVTMYKEESDSRYDHDMRKKTEYESWNGDSNSPKNLYEYKGNSCYTVRQPHPYTRRYTPPYNNCKYDTSRVKTTPGYSSTFPARPNYKRDMYERYRYEEPEVEEKHQKKVITPSPLEGVSCLDIQKVLDSAKKSVLASRTACAETSNTPKIPQHVSNLRSSLKIDIARYVIKQISKIKYNFTVSEFKSVAKVITNALVDKELRVRSNNPSYSSSEGLSNRMKSNIKKYLGEYFVRHGVDTSMLVNAPV